MSQRCCRHSQTRCHHGPPSWAFHPHEDAAPNGATSNGRARQCFGSLAFLLERRTDGFASPPVDGFALSKTLQGNLHAWREERSPARGSRVCLDSSVCRPPSAKLRATKSVYSCGEAELTRAMQAKAKCRCTTTAMLDIFLVIDQFQSSSIGNSFLDRNPLRLHRLDASMRGRMPLMIDESALRMRVRLGRRALDAHM